MLEAHSQQPAPIGAADVHRIVASMNPVTLQALLNTSGVSGDRPGQAMQALRSSKHKDRMVQFTNISFNNVGPGFGQRAAQQLEADVKAGALGVGEINKGFGLNARKSDGTRLKLDDPELDPIWQTAG